MLKKLHPKMKFLICMICLNYFLCLLTMAYNFAENSKSIRILSLSLCQDTVFLNICISLFYGHAPNLFGENSDATWFILTLAIDLPR